MSALATKGSFTQDWSCQRGFWPEMFKEKDWIGAPGLRFLEVGCFEGQTTRWLLENVLTDQSSTITVCDTFAGSPEFEQLGVDATDLPARFRANVAAHRERVVVVEGHSQETLRRIEGPFDFAYIDGSHRAADVLTDAILVWPLLRAGGLLVFDDYGWGLDGQTEFDRPRLGIDSFITVFAPDLVVRMAEYQFVVEKS